MTTKEINGEGVKRRGRPPKEKKEEPTDIELRVAELIHSDCGVPGCSAKWHLETAKAVIVLVQFMQGKERSETT